MEIQKIAAMAGGVVEGDPQLDIRDVASIETATTGDLVFAGDETWLALAEKSGASCILTTTTVRRSTKTLIRVANPKFAFLALYNILHKAKTRPAFTHPTAVIDDGVRRGNDVWIGPHVTIESGVELADGIVIEANTVIKKNCRIGPRTHLYPNVTLYENTELGSDVILHAGVVIGADGFGYVKEKGTIYKFPQLGKVVIGNNVEVGANTSIDRGSLSTTTIGENTKIDNLCQIAHNVKVGANVLMAAGCGVAGSVTIGNDVIIGGQVGIADNVVIGNNVTIAAQTGVIGTIADGAVIWGTPARDLGQVKRQIASAAWLAKNFHKLTKLIK